MSQEGCGPHLRHLIGWLEARAERLKRIIAKLDGDEDSDADETKVVPA